jgi:hypothetical protein
MEARLPEYVRGDEGDEMGTEAMSAALSRLEDLLSTPFSTFAATMLAPGEGSFRQFLTSLVAGRPRRTEQAGAAGSGDALLGRVEELALLCLARLVSGEYLELPKEETWRERLKLSHTEQPASVVQDAWGTALYESWVVDASTVLDIAALFCSNVGERDSSSLISPTIDDGKKLSAPRWFLARCTLSALLYTVPPLVTDIASMAPTIAEALVEAQSRCDSKPQETVEFLVDTVETVAQVVWSVPMLAEHLLVSRNASTGTTTPSPLLVELRHICNSTVPRLAVAARRKKDEALIRSLGLMVESAVGAIHTASCWLSFEGLGLCEARYGLREPFPGWGYRSTEHPQALRQLVSGEAPSPLEPKDRSLWGDRGPRWCGESLLSLVGSLRASDQARSDTSALLFLWTDLCGVREVLSHGLSEGLVHPQARSAVRDCLSLMPSRAAEGELGRAPSMMRRSSSGGASTSSVRSGGSVSQRAAAMGMTPSLREKTLQLAQLLAYQDEYNDDADDSLAEPTGAVDSLRATHEDEAEAAVEPVASEASFRASTGGGRGRASEDRASTGGGRGRGHGGKHDRRKLAAQKRSGDV